MEADIKTLKDTKAVKNSFYVGVVEDINDPQKLDRVRVRVLGINIHEKSGGKNYLKTEELPWANVMSPTVFGMSTGIGISYTPIEGTWVIVVFENNDYQKPLVLGSLKGFVPENQSSDSFGFTDPNKTYPLKDRLNESDTNRLHRNEDYSKTELHKKRDSNLEKAVPITSTGDTLDSTWSQPTELNTKTEYPHNTVIETKSGHIIEIDDTPGNERIHVFHSSGSFYEFRPDGTVSSQVNKDYYNVIKGNKHEVTKGDSQNTVEGNRMESTFGNKGETVGGVYNISSQGPTSVKSATQIFLTGQQIFLN